MTYNGYDLYRLTHSKTRMKTLIPYIYKLETIPLDMLCQ